MEAGGVGVPCRRNGCPGQGTWVPRMTFRPQDGRKTVTAEIPEVKICEMHRSESTLESFLSPEAWVKVEKFLRENGKGNFLRRNARLDWRRNEEQEILPF